MGTQWGPAIEGNKLCAARVDFKRRGPSVLAWLRHRRLLTVISVDLGTTLWRRRWAERRSSGNFCPQLRDAGRHLGPELL
mmetsp:Transcript_80168/g.179512  ORF Transcript_80168/g.179512 Transcript_80168/m.179512 type:complete len:80 (+) Transcript_80168:902-1141(+)